VTEAGPLVLLVEDEAPMRRLLRAALGAHGYRVVEAATAREARQLAVSHHPELLILDLGLPDGDGISLTRELRGWLEAPIVVISARGRESDKVATLDAGADDYLTKPFGVNELLARLRVALRNARGGRGGTGEAVIEIAGLRVDRDRREVTVEGTGVRLTPLEYRLLVVFVENSGRVLTYPQILKAVWGVAHGEAVHTVRVHVAALRKKIERDPARPRRLITEQGVGYRLVDE
jgi:two-component system KDP operon response regulator KdpE